MSNEENDSAIKINIRTPTSTRRSTESKISVNPHIDVIIEMSYNNDMIDLLGLTNDDLFQAVFSSQSSSIQSRKLNIQKYNNTVQNNTDECVICRRLYAFNDEMCVNQCSHIFHYKCLEQWIKVNPTCPVCRTTVPTTV